MIKLALLCALLAGSYAAKEHWNPAAFDVELFPVFEAKAQALASQIISMAEMDEGFIDYEEFVNFTSPQTFNLSDNYQAIFVVGTEDDGDQYLLANLSISEFNITESYGIWMTVGWKSDEAMNETDPSGIIDYVTC